MSPSPALSIAVTFLFPVPRMHLHHPGQAAVGGRRRRGGAVHAGRRQHFPD